MADQLTLFKPWGADYARQTTASPPWIQNAVHTSAVTSSGILKAKQKLGITFDSDKLGGIDFTKFSKLTHVQCLGGITFLNISSKN